MNEIPSFFSANSTVMHISNYCFDLQINHSRRNWKETKRGVIRPSSPYVWGPVIIIVENFSPSLILGIDPKSADDNRQWLDQFVERRKVESSSPEAD